jgi:glycosyltransferase involved in cell wall biosynthesis
MRFLVISNFAESLLGFRYALICALQAHGLDVHVAAPNLNTAEPTRLKLEAQGFTVHNIPMNRTGTNPIADLYTLWALWHLMRHIKPHAVLGYTVKPVIYGLIAARLAKIPKRYALITGLGYAFQGDGKRWRMQALVQHLYAFALSKVSILFFQNPDDATLFKQRNIVREDAPICMVNGSGVDLDEFKRVDLPGGMPRFLLIARLLGDKGVREYALAASRIRARHPDVRFMIAGWIDGNPDAIKQHELDAWVSEGNIEYLGRLNDVRPAIAASSVYVLPSYREGTPRTVLEAMAMGRAIITTDAPGCKETVIDRQNGYLVPVKSIDALERAMQFFIDDPHLVEKMGKRSHEIASKKYDVHQVNAKMLDAMGIE